jgi:hypothetical protein
MMGWSVDDNGDIWAGVRQQGIRHYRFDGLDPVGNPIYSYDTSELIPCPTGISDIKRVEYDAAHDRMFLGGFSANYRDSGDTWWALGRVICQYNNWSAGNRTPTFTYVMPWWTANPAPNTGAAKGMCVCGKYLFVARDKQGEILIYDVTTNTSKGSLLPTAVTGKNSGWSDIVNCVSAVQRANGEYLIFAEEDGAEKVMMYRWLPEN